MAEADGITTPAAPPSGPRRPHLPPPFEVLPVEPAVFENLHKVNFRFERLIHTFRTLQAVPYFPHDQLTAWEHILYRIQAEANDYLAEAIQERAQKTAAYFDRLCLRHERELADPDDVLIEAEYRRQELAEEQQNEEKQQDSGT